jgi:hypothetical protein
MGIKESKTCIVISDHEKKIHEKWIMGDDEESLMVCCATNHGDQVSKLQNFSVNNIQQLPRLMEFDSTIQVHP